MSVRSHSIIPQYHLDNVYKHFGAIDSVLSLHYTNHITNPSLPTVLDNAASLIRLRINFRSLEVILALSPNMYELFVDENYNYTISPKNIPIREFNKHTIQRKEWFLKDLNTWIVENNEESLMPTIPVLAVAKKVVKNSRTSPCKVTKSSPSPSPNSSRVNLLQDLKNESSKFRFKSKDEEVQKQNTTGLSLLERIKLKEKLNKEKKLTENPQQQYQSYINDKLVIVYNIIYELRGGHETLDGKKTDSSKSYPLPKLISQIEDSLQYPIGRTEILDVVRAISSRLLNNKVEIISRDGISIVKVSCLDHDNDVKLLA